MSNLQFAKRTSDPSVHALLQMSDAILFERLLTHPGSAHKDDFLACCLLLAKSPVPIERREPDASDLEDPRIAVIDVGDRHQPEKGNFDHHQFPRETPPTCSLSLTLQYLGLYEDAKLFCDWLETTEWLDCRGPNGTAEWLGVERDVVSKLNSPVDITLLRRFAATPVHQAGEPLWEIMRMIGEDMVTYLTTTRERIAYVAERAERWEIDGLSFLFLPRSEPLPDEPSAGLGHYLREKGWNESIAGLVYPDRRNTGYGISRYNDHPALDFTKIEGEADVHFAHKSGFLAKTTAADPDRLKSLVAQGIKKGE